jgi:MOSC domain-containing protein YiiM
MDPHAPAVRHLYISPGHNFFGHHGQPAGEHPAVEVESVTCVAGRGLVGDRFFDYAPNYPGQVTFFAYEVYADLCVRLNVRDRTPAALRRNIITVAADLNAWIGREFTLQGVRFRGVQEARPCYWMEGAFGPGAKEAMQGRGGLRAEILSDGVIYAPVLAAE